MSRWVNYKELREAMDFAQVLEDYDVEVTVKGDQALGFCPLPGHQTRSKRKSRSFSVNLPKGIFQCFGCQAKGNVLEFGIMMEGLDPADKGQFRKGALKLKERYLGSGAAPERKREEKGSDETPEKAVKRVINAPLDFELKSIDGAHPYLKERGLTAKTVKCFGIGYCNRGMMKSRVVIPLHDREGQLIGYAGRLVDDEAIDEDNPKYKLPGSRKKGDVVHEFWKSEFLFNGHRFNEAVDDLIVVEGFFGAMWLHQASYKNVVALMGASCSQRQADLIIKLVREGGRVWAMADGDEAGEKCAVSLFQAIGPKRLVGWIQLSGGQQPESFSKDTLERLLEPIGW